jgi:drug/metabolite transporter (DMT)-like permease
MGAVVQFTPLAPASRVEFIVTETFQFIITLVVLLGGGWLIEESSDKGTIAGVAGFIGAVLTFWFNSRTGNRSNGNGTS